MGSPVWLGVYIPICLPSDRTSTKNPVSLAARAASTFKVENESPICAFIVSFDIIFIIFRGWSCNFILCLSSILCNFTKFSCQRLVFHTTPLRTNLLPSSHPRPQYFWYGDAAVGVLVAFQNGDQDAGGCDAGVVEGVGKVAFAIFILVF